MYGGPGLEVTDTTTLGAYQMIQAFEKVCSWAVEEYEPWYLRNAIGSNDTLLDIIYVTIW